MRKLYMMVGVPGSGKSTYVNGVRGRLDYQDFNEAVVLSTDKFIEASAKAENVTYNLAFHENIKLAEMQLNADLKKAIHDGKDIVWDQTNVSAKTRKAKLAKIPKHYHKIALVFCANPDIINEVNEKRKEFGRDIPAHILESMIKNFEMPTKEEGFNEIIVINR